MNFKIILFILIGLISFTHCAKILFLVIGGNFSHKNSIWPLVTSLADEGHNVTFLSSQQKSPMIHPKVNDLAPKPLVDLMSQAYAVDRLKARKEGKDVELWNAYTDVTVAACKAALQSNDQILNSIINDKSFDLAVINAVFGECGYFLAHRLGVKYIISDSTSVLPWFNDLFGIPVESSWIPQMSSKFDRGSFPLSLWDRLRNSIQPLYWHYQMTYDMSPRLEALYKETFKVNSVPTLAELERNASLMFVNSHESFDFARPLPPFVKSIGGLQCFNNKDRPIPKEFLDVLDDDDVKDVIIVAFGSTIELSKMPKPFQDMFFDTMRMYKDVHFIWKWDGPIDNAPPNLRAFKWLPQIELLGHKKIRAFITHAGSNSIIEATSKAVPLIVVPLFADQDFNAFRIEVHEVGIRLEGKYLDTKMLQDAVGEILSNPKYKKQMKMRSEMFNDRPKNPIEEAVYWINYVLRHDDFSGLKQMNSEYEWYKKRDLDLYLFAAWLLLLLPLIIIYAMHFVYKIFKN